jgi:hypothetical protein
MKKGLREKLAENGSGVQKATIPPVFKPKSTIDQIPGRAGQILIRDAFKNCHPRQGDLAVEEVDLRIMIAGEELRQAQAREDPRIEGILGGAFMAEDIPRENKFKLLVKPVQMKDVAMFRLERIKAITKMSLDYVT